jgi:signal transduction histidine kinase
MTTDLLDLHRVEQTRTPLHIEEVRLDELAEWARGQYAHKAEAKSVALAVEMHNGDFAFRTDRTLVQLILQNLLDNAIKFTPSGGHVTFGVRPHDRRVLLSVADTGCGIPPEIQERVFERFFQADPARSGDGRVRGTGLGLAIVKHACERLGAEVRLTSAVGEGTTVEIEVPERA